MSTTISGDTGVDKVDSSAIISASSIMTALNASGTAPIYACRAWVNFNGTGTVAIRASGNVSSITDNGVGDYTVNFTTAMVDVNYSVSNTGVASQIGPTLGGLFPFFSGVATIQAPTTSAFRVQSENLVGAHFDTDYALLSIFR